MGYNEPIGGTLAMMLGCLLIGAGIKGGVTLPVVTDPEACQFSAQYQGRDKAGRPHYRYDRRCEGE